MESIEECMFQKVSALPGEEEKNLILYEFNKTGVYYPKDKKIDKLFEEQAERTPENIAVACNGAQITYDELNRKANQLAGLLRSRGVKNDCIVGVMTDRSIEMVIAIIGILKAGGAYLPIDHEYPKDRVNFMLEDSHVRILLTEKHLIPKIEFDGDIIDLGNMGFNSFDASNHEQQGSSTDLAYVIYTSGSTGKPKGVMIEHRSVVNFIKGITDIIEFTPDKRILSITTISFDIFVLESLLPLTKGLTVVVADKRQQMEPKALNELALKYGIEMMQTTPSRMKMILSDRNSISFLKGLKEIMIGGESFPAPLLIELKSLTDARIYNMYGPTETTVWSTVKELTDSEGINIGKPIANTVIYIMDNELNLMAPDCTGELYIGGDGLARGYLDRPELTADRFVKNPFLPEERIYRTGDLGRWMRNGELECLGRVDNQVKIRGYRIELGEIEEKLSAYASVKEAAVTAKMDENGVMYLCAYVTTDLELNIQELRHSLENTLPEYMVPTFIIKLDKLPLTPNGKIDRNSLPDPHYFLSDTNEYIPPSDELEEKLAAIWKEVLDIEEIGTNSDFFDMGGHSISVVKLEVTLENNGIYFDYFDMEQYKTIKEMADFIKRRDG